MKIENNILRYYLQNAYFITGTAYAGKSTMVKMLSEKHDMIFCGENYHGTVAEAVRNPKLQPGLCYFETMSGWQEFLNRTPEEYFKWICETSREAAEIEVAELIRLSATGKKIIVDTNIPVDLLHVFSDYHHVAVMLSPQSMSVERFFDRSDPEKQFLLGQIEKAENPEKTMQNFRACMARCNSLEEYNKFAAGGFYTIVREDTQADTRADVLQKLEKHFRL